MKELHEEAEVKLDRLERLARLRLPPFRWLLLREIRSLREEVSKLREQELAAALEQWSRPSRAGVFVCEDGHLHTRIDRRQGSVQAVDLVEVAVGHPGADIWMVEIIGDNELAIVPMEIRVDAASAALIAAMNDLLLPPAGADG